MYSVLEDFDGLRGSTKSGSGSEHPSGACALTDLRERYAASEQLDEIASFEYDVRVKCLPCGFDRH